MVFRSKRVNNTMTAEPFANYIKQNAPTFVFDTVDDMNAAIQAGDVPAGAIIYCNQETPGGTSGDTELDPNSTNWVQNSAIAEAVNECESKKRFISTRTATTPINIKTWIPKTWNGFNDLNGNNIWTDGDNIYYSNNAEQYVLDKKTSTWIPKTWSGLSQPYGYWVWTDGENIYHSYETTHYVLDKETSTWIPKTWTGLTSIIPMCIWTDGDDIYYSNGSNQYVLDKTTSTWTTKTWTGLTNFFGGKNTMWTDGDNIYYSSGSDQYVLKKGTSVWRAKTWAGLTSFYGGSIWTDGDNIYYSDFIYDPPAVEKSHYVLNRETSTWTTKIWSGGEYFNGTNIWTDGENIYCSQSYPAGTQYMLSSKYDNKIVGSVDINNINGNIEKLSSDLANITTDVSNLNSEIVLSFPIFDSVSIGSNISWLDFTFPVLAGDVFSWTMYAVSENPSGAITVGVSGSVGGSYLNGSRSHSQIGSPNYIFAKRATQAENIRISSFTNAAATFKGVAVTIRRKIALS